MVVSLKKASEVQTVLFFFPASRFVHRRYGSLYPEQGKIKSLQELSTAGEILYSCSNSCCIYSVHADSRRETVNPPNSV